jgi:diguanylate cyclase (GGDEF)-like protein
MRQVPTRIFKLNKQKAVDPLTGLPTQPVFKEELVRALVEAEHNQELVAIIFLDINRFKRVNDTMGPTMGDQLMVKIVERIRTCLPSSTLLARFNGDEFTFLVKEIKKEIEAVEVAEVLIQCFNEPFLLEEHEVYVSSSLGISFFPFDGMDYESLLQKSSIAVHWAKLDRHHYKLYEEAMIHDLPTNMNLESDLRRALVLEEFTLFYQPLVDAHNGHLVALEALIRWQHPTKGLLLPASFIPAAEELGLIIPITEWVIQQACTQNRKWLDQGCAIVPISVNLSASNFHHTGLVEYINSVLEKIGLPSRYLELEITESISMHNHDFIVHTLQQLDRLGIKIAIDDFGMGYSSLRYLKYYPINSLKIDRSFIQDIAKGDGTLANTVISLAHQFNLQVTAEGVENGEQLEYLKQQKCDRMQGFFFGKPEPAHKISEKYF